MSCKEMYQILILTNIAYLVLCASSYEYVCPTNLGWKIRSKALCNSTAKYSCLYDENKAISREICREKTSMIAAGNKYVIRGNLDGEDCTVNRYQPFIFMSDKNNKCAILKSNCKEKGQIIYSNGSTTEDKSCRCDYSKNYAPVVNPNHPCYCMPSEEDCSCYQKLCPYKTHLSSDYVCVSDYTLVSLDDCGLITGDGESDTMMEIELNIDPKFRDRRDNTLWLLARITVLAGVFLSAVLIMISGSEDFKVQPHDPDKGSVIDIITGSEDFKVQPHDPDKGSVIDIITGAYGVIKQPSLSDSKEDIIDDANGDIKQPIESLMEEPDGLAQLQRAYIDNSANGDIKQPTESLIEGANSDIKQFTESIVEGALENGEYTQDLPKKQDADTIDYSEMADEETRLLSLEMAIKAKNIYLEKETRIILIGRTDDAIKSIGSKIIEFGDKIPLTIREGITTRYTKINDRFFVVVEMLALNNMNSINLKQHIQFCIWNTSPGPHAILYVSDATDMYKPTDDTMEDKTFKYFLSYFSSEICKYGIVVLTQSDGIRRNNNNCKEAAKQRDNKVVSVFENRLRLNNCNKEKTFKCQIEPLLEMINKIRGDNNAYYTNYWFKECEKRLQEKELVRLRTYISSNNNKYLQHNNGLTRMQCRMQKPKDIKTLISFEKLEDSNALNLPKAKNADGDLEETQAGMYSKENHTQS